MNKYAYYVYILASRPCGSIYIGVTNDLVRRVQEHRDGTGSKHTKKYKIHRLVYYESFENIDDAIDEEKRLKHWKRPWKDKLGKERNPNWRDLFNELKGSWF